MMTRAGRRPREQLYRCVCGLDVHKKVVIACVRRLDESGRVTREI
jgi:hypothetical protein